MIITSQCKLSSSHRIPRSQGEGSTLSRLRLCARLERGWALRGTAEKKYSLGTFSSGRRLHTIPYHTIPLVFLKIEFPKLNLKIEFHDPPNGSWKVLGCNTGIAARSVALYFPVSTPLEISILWVFFKDFPFST